MLLGATGLVGGHLLEQLTSGAGYEHIVVVSRRTLDVTSNVEVVVGDLGDPASYADVAQVDDIYCCLGTTIKKAGSQEAFRLVDLEVPLVAARAGRAAGASQYIIVTAVGADPASRIFYNRIKGEVELALEALQFPGGVKIVRPSILLGERQESRPAERVASTLLRFSAPAFGGPLARYRAIEASQVARAMLHAGLHEPAGSKVYEGRALFELADS